ncbi:DUF1573 domain-containing protein [Galbibacter sp. EGI 63066]|uniref:DUF1573 domain-containing protein n=1 Tax=Galbibacter sp. EGI 63066 TaxID=2993559 RepID=UPI002248D199|nr:DUF1573 domain-containing protein [Galbibacter sp. EGI 63066]MCX2679696.1 DUF1573 domain-containing protein [Galbibacter sp. EGI 63066]
MLSKIIITINILLFFGCAKHTKEAKENTPTTNIAFNTKIITVETISKNDTIKAEYNFKNIGDVPLIIESVIPDCSCIDFEYSKNSIFPNDSGHIKLKYISTNNYIKKKLHTVVKANTKSKFHKLTLKIN